MIYPLPDSAPLAFDDRTIPDSEYKTSNGDGGHSIDDEKINMTCTYLRAGGDR